MHWWSYCSLLPFNSLSWLLWVAVQFLEMTLQPLVSKSILLRVFLFPRYTLTMRVIHSSVKQLSLPVVSFTFYIVSLLCCNCLLVLLHFSNFLWVSANCCMKLVFIVFWWYKPFIPDYLTSILHALFPLTLLCREALASKPTLFYSLKACSHFQQFWSPV